MKEWKLHLESRNLLRLYWNPFQQPTLKVPCAESTIILAEKSTNGAWFFHPRSERSISHRIFAA